MISIGEFNSCNWYNKDITTHEDRKIERVTSQKGLHQESNEPTHILSNFSLYINFVVNSQPNLLIESSVYPSLHSSCHHQIIGKNLTQFIVYPPPYEREIPNYQKVNIDLIQRAINSFDWEKPSNIDVNNMVYIFNETIINMLSNFIPYQTVLFDCRDPP